MFPSGAKGSLTRDHTFRLGTVYVFHEKREELTDEEDQKNQENIEE